MKGENQHLHVLLWAPDGSGLQYSGPGMTAFRLYEAKPPSLLSVELAHGSPNQEQTALYEKHTLIYPLSRSQRSVIPFLYTAKNWLRENAARMDIFHGLQGFHPTVLPALWAQELGVPSVVKLAALRTELVDKGRIKTLLGLARKRRSMLNKISGVIAISEAIIDELLEYGIERERIAHIPNAVRTEIFFPAADDVERASLRAALGLKDLPTIVFSGSIIPRKQPHLLVEALHKIHQNGIEAQLILAGPHRNSVNYYEHVIELIKDLSLQEHVFLPGFVKDMAPLYRAANVFSLPSKSEGLANALLEAMASGLPAVVTNFSGTQELIGDSPRGQIVRTSADEISEALAYYLNNEQASLQAGVAAVKLMNDQYGSAKIMREHIDLFQRIRAGVAATNIF